MRSVTAMALAVILSGTPVLVAQQAPLKPTAPGSSGDPVWQAVVRLSDDRRFITDGGLAIDTSFAKPDKLPEREVPGKILESYFVAPHKEEYGFSDLTANASGRTYTMPNGIPQNATYINYLRRVLPTGRTRFRVSGEMQPIVIWLNGKAVGVLMAVKK